MGSITQTISQERDVRLQWIRSIGAILVVCLHSASELMYRQAYGSLEWWFDNIVNGLSRCAVPLFVMASGAIFLGRQEDFQCFYQKRLKRIAIPLVFWTIVYILFAVLINNVSITNLAYFKNLAKALYNGKPYYHLWYLYMLIGLYLAVPFLQRLWGAINDKQKLLFVLFCFLLSAVSPFESAFLPVDSGNPAFLLYRFLPYVGYFVCGRFIIEQADKKKESGNIIIVISLIVLAAITIIGSYITGSNKEPGKYFFHYLSFNVILFTVLLFNLMIRLIRSDRKPPRVIGLIDKTGLAIYLVHPMLLVYAGYVYDYLKPQGGLFCLFIVLKILSVLAVSMIIGWVMMKLPILKKTVS